MTGLTHRQRECLDVIQRLTVDGVSPSFEEIGAAIGLSSKSGVHRLVHGLAERGHIYFLPDRRRTIAVAHKGKKVPFDGMAAAIVDHFFDGDPARASIVRRVLVEAWRTERAQ